MHNFNNASIFTNFFQKTFRINTENNYLFDQSAEERGYILWVRPGIHLVNNFLRWILKIEHCG